MNQYSTRVAKKNLVTTLPSRAVSFSNTFFPYCINERKKLNDNLGNANSVYKFKNYLTMFIKFKENCTFSTTDPLGLKLLTPLQLNFSHLNEHKFRCSFKDIVSPMCSCGTGIETTDHYLLRCQNCAIVRSRCLNIIFKINVEFRIMNDSTLTSLLLFSSEEQTFDVSTKILNLTIQLLKDTGRFDEPLI